MNLRRKKPPVLASISAVGAPGAGRPGVLRRGDLEALSALLRGLEGCRVLLVTGSTKSKPGAALGLGSAAVAAGGRAALVECDFNAPSLAAALGLSPTPGLHEYLAGQASAQQILQPALLTGPASGGAAAPLICVVAGAPSPDGAQLVACEDFRHAVAKLRSAYELVVIDGPPTDQGRESLAALQAEADATLACLGLTESARRLPLSVTGVLQRS